MSREHNGSAVWAAFEKIAAESNLITPNLTPAQKHIENRKKDVPTGDDYTRHPKTEEYGVTEGEGKDVIEKAHKEDAQVASAMGKGGLVENEVQQQEKDIEIALKMPDGTLHGVHAAVVSDLVKLANALDEGGNEKAAKRVDAAIKEIRNLPFVHSHLRKEAAWFLPLLGLLGRGALAVIPKLFTLKGALGTTALIGGLKMFGAKLTSQVDNLSTDIKDLYDALQDSSEESKSAVKAAQILEPFLKIQQINISTEGGYQEFAELALQLKPVLGNLSKYIVRIKEDYQMGTWEKMKSWVGVESPKTIEAAYDDLVTSLGNTLKLINKGGQLKSQIERAGEKFMGSTLLQKINGLTKGQELDQDTAQELVNLEQKLTQDLSDDISKSDGGQYDFTGKIVSDGKLAMDPAKLSRIVELAKQVNSRNR